MRSHSQCWVSAHTGCSIAKESCHTMKEPYSSDRGPERSAATRLWDRNRVLGRAGRALRSHTRRSATLLSSFWKEAVSTVACIHMMYVLLILDLGSSMKHFLITEAVWEARAVDSLSLSVLSSAPTVSQESNPELRSWWSELSGNLLLSYELGCTFAPATT